MDRSLISNFRRYDWFLTNKDSAALFISAPVYSVMNGTYLLGPRELTTH